MNELSSSTASLEKLGLDLVGVRQALAVLQARTTLGSTSGIVDYASTPQKL